MCLSLTVAGVEARVRHASISGETVQLPQIAMFKPCQLLIHLASKLCIRWAELVCNDFLPFDTAPCVPDCLNYRRTQRSGPSIATPSLKQDPFAVFNFSTSSLMATQWLQALALHRQSSDWHPLHLSALRTHLVSPPCLLATPAVSMAQEASLDLCSV